MIVNMKDLALETLNVLFDSPRMEEIGSLIEKSYRQRIRGRIQRLGQIK